MMTENEYLETAGKFPCVVVEPTSGYLVTRGSKETPAIRLPLLINDGPQEGKKITWFGYLTDASVEFTIRAMAEALGFDGDLAALQDGRTVLGGTICQVVAEWDEWEGEKRLKAKYINPAGVSAPKLDDSSAASIIDSIGGKAKAIAADALKGKALMPSLSGEEAKEGLRIAEARASVESKTPAPF